MLCSNLIANEIPLYNNDGEAVAYIDTEEDLTIYLWSGKPVAYLEKKSDRMLVYGFNGKHLGWFDNGAIYNSDGDVSCALKNLLTKHPQALSYKGYKEYKPYKSYKDYPDWKPSFSRSFSQMPCELHLSFGGED
jgi:hypothetical protein